MDYFEYLAKPNKTIKEHNEDLLKQLSLLNKYGYIKDKNIYSLVKTACKYHDIGKANDQFNMRVKSNKKIRFDETKEIPHNVLSAFLLDKNLFDNDDDYKCVLFAIANHHNYVDVCDYINKNRKLISEILEKMNIHKKSFMKITSSISSQINNKNAALVKGFLHKCDYSASAGETCEYQNDFLEDGLENFINGMKKNSIADDWNEMQKYCISNKDNNIIITAQTGMGKTEGALNWIGNNKGYFVLPLRTAINAMYDRIRKQIIVDDSNLNQKLAVLHSSSIEYYLQNLSDISEKEQLDLFEYEHRGKEWSLPLNITTMDQLFDFVFKYQGYELKLTTLSYSKIVIDEIQMYDPNLLAYLIFGLERISKFGGKIAILTATLPPFIEDMLTKNINFSPKKQFVDSKVRHNVKVIEDKLRVNDIIKKYNENKKENKSNKILVICNTVKKSQEVYDLLLDSLNDEKENIRILHSRFTRNDRNKLEQDIKKFGETYKDKNNKIIDKNDGIWISTSLVEASLDIDFDYLFTELQDLCSLFQRFGRCNRKGVKDCSTPNCYIYTSIDQAILIHGNKGFIDKTLYEISKEAILNISGQITEKQKIELIDNNLTSDNLKNSSYMKNFNYTYDNLNDIIPYKFDKNEVDLRNIYSSDIIPSKVYEDNIEDINELISRINDKSICKEERYKLISELMGYTVSVPNYILNNYLKAVKRNEAEVYPCLNVNKYQKINVIDSEYDDKGFYPRKYELQIAEGEFL